MLFSLSLIVLIGFSLSGIFNRIKLPGLIGMILTGIILGPYSLNLISPTILEVSKELREMALIVILIRAGLSIDLKDLKKVGRPAILMCFVPATFEIIAITLIAPLIFKISYIEAAILGSVLAAVSPAVIVPRMIHYIESGYGKKKSIPQLIMAGASVDDIYVIVLFSSFISIALGREISASALFSIPASIILGILLGAISGLVLVKIFKSFHMRDTMKVLIMLSVGFLMVSLEAFLKSYLPISGLIAVMSMGASILKNYELLAKRIMGKFSKIWVGAEILLFVLVGAAVNIHYAANAGFNGILLIVIAMLFRLIGVLISLIKTNLDKKERLFCSIAYIPKATVQAAIGAIPLSLGIKSGELILTLAVLAILITAPIGAMGLDRLHKRLLS